MDKTSHRNHLKNIVVGSMFNSTKGHNFRVRRKLCNVKVSKSVDGMESPESCRLPRAPRVTVGRRASGANTEL